MVKFWEWECANNMTMDKAERLVLKGDNPYDLNLSLQTGKLWLSTADPWQDRKIEEDEFIRWISGVEAHIESLGFEIEKTYFNRRL